MKEKHPPQVNDSTDLVIHTRQSMFVSLLVSAVVLIGVLSHATTVIQEAIDQLNTVRKLMMYLDNEAQGASVRPLATLLTGSDSLSDFNTGFLLQLAPVEQQEPSRATQEARFNQPPSKLECMVVLDLTQYFFVPDNAGHHYITVHGSPNGQPNLFVRSLDGSGRPWDVVSSTSLNLSNFIRLWDTLASMKRAGRIVLIDPHAGAMITGTPMGYSRAAFRVDYEVDESTIVEVAANVWRPTVTGIVLLKDFINSRTNDPSLNPISWDTQYPEDVLTKWDTGEFEALTSARCFGKRNGEAVQYLVTMPAALRYESFDWLHAWGRRAIETGYLEKIDVPTSQSFAVAFPDLYRESKDMESLDIEELEGLLMSRSSSRSDQSVSFFGVSIPAGLLRTVGILLIFVLQTHSILHLVETVTRMSDSVPGDPGAFKPWIMLYQGPFALFVSICILFAPSLVAIVVVLHLVEGEFSSSVSVVTSVVGMILSWTVTVFGLVNVRKLRREAKKHRQASTAQNPTAVDAVEL